MDLELQVMHNLAVHGMARPDTLLERVPGSEEDIGPVLEDLREKDLVAEEGFLYLTDEGDATLNDLCQERFTGDETGQIEGLFESFETLDEELKEIAVEWQNVDESDEETVENRIQNLVEFHGQITKEVDQLDGAPREEYSWYLERLSDAVTNVQEGQFEYFTGSDVASYHNVWFAFHEDLLRTLGEERTA